MEIICVICTERLFGTDYIIATSCNHCFHEKCFNEWKIKCKFVENLFWGQFFINFFSTAQTCPECREPSVNSSCRRLFFNSEARPDKPQEKYQQQIITLRNELLDQKRNFECQLHAEVEIRKLVIHFKLVPN